MRRAVRRFSSEAPVIAAQPLPRLNRLNLSSHARPTECLNRSPCARPSQRLNRLNLSPESEG